MNDDPAFADSTWVPDACILPTVERPLRLAEFDDLFTDGVRVVQRVRPTRVELELRVGDGVAARVADLAARETACCSFFAFDLVITGDRLVLGVETPHQHIDVLDALSVRALAACGERP